MRQLQSSLQEPKTDVHLYPGDAIYRENVVGHPQDPASSKVFDRILALDCAYHFNTRKIFLRQSFHKLVPGGRIALTDICFDPIMLKKPQVRLITSLLRLIPKHNMVSSGDYIAQMKEIGYIDVQLQDVTENVFPGFIRFLKSRGLGWMVFGWMVECYAQAGARFVIVSGSAG